MDEPTEPRHRQPSPEILAYRVENKQMMRFRQHIGHLQSRIAFITARVAHDGSPSHEALAADLRAARTVAEELRIDIEAIVPAGASLGPADNCRRALAVLLDRLDQIAP